MGLPLGGQECGLVRAASSYTQAYHVMRTMAGGLLGVSGLRSSADKRARPRRCSVCGHPHVAWAWTTTTSEVHPGKEWCRGCIPDAVWADGVPGGALTDNERGDIGSALASDGILTPPTFDPNEEGG